MKISNLFIFLLAFFSVSCVSTIPINKRWKINVDKDKDTDMDFLIYSFNKAAAGKNFSVNVRGGKVKAGYWEKGVFKDGWEASVKYGAPEPGQKTPQESPGLVIVNSVDNEKVTPFFRARGYIFYFISPKVKPDAKTPPVFRVRHWSGGVDCAFTDFIFFKSAKKEPVLMTEHRKARLVAHEKQVTVEAGRMCE